MIWIGKILVLWIVGSVALGVAWVALIELFRFNIMKNFVLQLRRTFHFLTGQISPPGWIAIIFLGLSLAIFLVTQHISQVEAKVESQEIVIQEMRRDIIQLYSMQDSTVAAGRSLER